MTNINLDFTADKQTNSNFEPIPQGMYLVACTNAETKTTKAGNGTYINAEFTVKAGEYEGRKVFQTFTLSNQNQQAVDIGRGQIKALLIASGATDFRLKSVNDLCGKVVTAKVGIETSEQYGARNKITSFSAATKIHDSTKAAKSANPFV